MVQPGCVRLARGSHKPPHEIALPRGKSRKQVPQPFCRHTALEIVEQRIVR
jgi:hypothetical protein